MIARSTERSQGEQIGMIARKCLGMWMFLAALFSVPLSAEETEPSDLNEWRSQGARPAFIAMLADGSIREDRELIEMLRDSADRAVAVEIDGRSKMDVSVTEADARFFAEVLQGVNLNEWYWGSKQVYFVRLAMMNEAMHNRLRRFLASKFLAEWEKSVAADDPTVMQDAMINFAIGGLSDISRFETDYLMGLGAEALRMIEKDGLADFPPEVYAEIGAVK
jgi:hypothetical protein